MLPMGPESCPRWEGCGAPICPLDPDWHKRSYLAGSPVCHFMRLHAKEQAGTISEGSVPREIGEAVGRVLPQAIARYAPLERALERASRTPPRGLPGSRL
jgi:hypothetical protein